MTPLDDQLRAANLAFAAAHPGDGGKRQPVTVLYGGAQLFRPDRASMVAAVARQALEDHAGTPALLAEAVGLQLPPALLDKIHSSLRRKIEQEAVEDYRIDFEDGYGNRPDAEE